MLLLLQNICWNGDLRKNLLQLQYFLLSNPKIVTLTDLKKPSYEEILTAAYKPLKKREKKIRKLLFFEQVVKSNVFYSLVDNLDDLIVVSSLLDIKDPTFYLIDYISEPHTCLMENLESFTSLDNLSTDIGFWIYKNMLNYQHYFKKRDLLENVNNHCLKYNKGLCKTITSSLSQVAHKTLDKYALAIDYFPSIRTICRKEEVRNRFNRKRGNRFFHYLQNSKLSDRIIKSENFIAKLCKALQGTNNVEKII